MKSDFLKSINQQTVTFNKLILECRTLREEASNLKSIQSTQEQRQRNYIVTLFNLPRVGRPAKSTSRPSHIILISSSEPPRNPRPFNIFFKVSNPSR